MKKDNILLLTDVLPCKNYSGGILTLQLVKFLMEEKVNISCVCIKEKSVKEVLDEEIIQQLDYIILDKPHETGYDSRVKRRNYEIKIEKILNKILEFIKNKNITKIWCPIQGEVLVRVLEKIADITGIPYIVQIWDPIEWILDEKNYTKIKKDLIVGKFENLLVNAEYCFTASKSMTEIYKKKYNKNSIEIYTSVELPRLQELLQNKAKKEFVIALSGQIYAVTEVEKLLEALNRLEWKYKDKKIIFRYFGNTDIEILNREKYEKGNIELKGFVPQNVLMKENSKTNLLYCPYFFSKNATYRKISEQSFPSKIVTYIPTKVPMLIHAPEYSSIYKFFNGKNAAYMLTSRKVEDIKNEIIKVIEDTEKNRQIMVNNAIELYKENFLPDKVKANFLKGLNIEYKPTKKLNILQVNYVDLPGRRFSGYDIQQKINRDTIHSSNQIVTYKTSEDRRVYKYYKKASQQELEYILLDYESNKLSVHSNLSLTSPMLKQSDLLNNADVVHYHMIHNAKLSLYSMIELCSKKPSIMTIHDPWTFTGRCVHYGECSKWMNGCYRCPDITTMFPFKEDNCHSMWKLKQYVYKNIDIDIVVATEYMLDLVKTSPLTKHFKHVHLIPFGVDLKYFSNRIDKKKSREQLNINNKGIVLFFREQEVFKGTEYIVEALKELEVDEEITLLTCGQKGLLKELKNKYEIVELGNIDNEKMLYAYNACDIFLMPSTGESFGLMAVEAMACEKPVVVFNNTALPSVTFAPECGVLVENKNSQKLKEAIIHLIKDKGDRIRRGKLGRKLAEEHYDINICNEKLIKLYEEVYNREHENIKIDNSKEINYSDNNAKLIVDKLNTLTKSITNKGSKEYKTLIYKSKRLVLKNIKINYANINVQKIIDEYNDKLYKISEQKIISVIKTNNGKNAKNLIINIKNIPFYIKQKNPRVHIIRAIKLFKEDPFLFKHAVAYKFRNHPIILKILKAIYKPFKKIYY